MGRMPGRVLSNKTSAVGVPSVGIRPDGNVAVVEGPEPCPDGVTEGMRYVAWLDGARALACIGIVLLHVATAVRLVSPIGTLDWWTGNVYGVMGRWCVPAFVMISGALLLDPGRAETATAFYKKRLSRILVPFVFWTVFYLAWAFFKSAMKGEPLPASELARRWFSGRPHYHLWFLYMLLGLYWCAPFLRYVVARAPRGELVGAVVVMFIIAAAQAMWTGLRGQPEGSLFVVWFLPYVPYFVVGHLLCSAPPQPTRPWLWGVLAASFAATVCACYWVSVYVGPAQGLYFHWPLSVTVIPMSLAVMFVLRDVRLPGLSKATLKKMASLTLGIYVVHPLFLEVVNYDGLWTKRIDPIVSVPFLTVVVFVLSVAATWMMSRVPLLKRLV